MAESIDELPEARSGGNRRQSRRYAVQAVYQYLIADTELAELARQFAGQDGYKRCDRAYFQQLVRGAIKRRDSLEESFESLLDRPVDQLDSVEHAVLLVASTELMDCLETPYKVILHESVELAKVFGSVEGFRYVNGVLDKVAAQTRAAEIAASS